MEHAVRFADVVEAADQLTLEEQEELLEIVKKRTVVRRRAELLKGVEETEREFQAGHCCAITVDEFVGRVFPGEPLQWR